ncbi:MAG: hypothetical protein RLZZ480_779 [Candidatus Parcubacteria bacterium]|jgi:hypothetical protein
MKKNIISLFVAGAALVATPAFAACTFDGNGAVKVGALMTGDASAAGQASMTGVLEKFWAAKVSATETVGQKAIQAGCTQAQFNAEMVRVNGGDSSRMFSFADVADYPKVVIAPAAAAPAAPPTQPPAAKLVEQPVSQPSGAPAPSPSASANAETPVRNTTIVQKVELSPADKAEMAALSASRKQLQDQIDTINAKPAPTEADLTALAALEKAKKDVDAKLKEFDEKLTAISGRVNNQAIEMSGMWNWIYGIIIAMVLGFIYFRRRTSNTNRRVKSLETHTEDCAKTVAIIPEDLAEQLQTLAINEPMTFSIPVNGSLHNLTFTRVDAGMVGNTAGKLMVVTDDIDRQTYPMKVDRSLVGKLYKAIDAGRFPKRAAAAPAPLREVA